jgi:hypothetical protein
METKEVKLLAFGGGVDSTALLAMHLERDKAAKHLGMSRAKLDELFPPFEAAVFSDPGSEWPETYENIEYAKARCAVFGVELVVVRHHLERYFHKETNEALQQKQWKSLPEDEREMYEPRNEPYTISEWLLDGGMLPLMPGAGHICSMRFKGGVQQQWADERFGDATVCTKHWSLGIEKDEGGRTDRFTANHSENKIEGHEYNYPLQGLEMNREECLDMLDHLGWDYRGDGSPVQKSSCMWCPFCKEWEVDRLIDADGEGLKQALAIEKRFVETDKHAKWHEAGMPLNRGGRCNHGHHRMPYATGWCEHPECTHVYVIKGLTGDEKKEFPKPYTPGSWKLTPTQWEKGVFSTYYAGIIESPLSEEDKARYTKTPVKDHGPARLISKKYDGKRKSIEEHIQRRKNAIIVAEITKDFCRDDDSD